MQMRSMIDETIKQIETRIQAVESMSGEKRQELLGLLKTLRSEAGELAKTHGEQARSINLPEMAHHPSMPRLELGQFVLDAFERPLDVFA